MQKFLCALFFFAVLDAAIAEAQPRLSSRQDEAGRISILFGDEVGAVFHAGETLPRHTVNPFTAPGGTALTRAFPFRNDIPGEPQDHPHHTGVWMAHGLVNGTDYWTRRLSDAPVFPRIVAQSPATVESNPDSVRVTLAAAWQPSSDKVDLHENISLTFSQPDATVRVLDWDCTLTAAQEKVVLGDTKEGFMAVRVATFLNLKGKGATGSMFDSEGRKNASVWGNPAKWVVYTGASDGQHYALAILDHPENHGHPTHWHARDYGLAAANPFGLHDFKKGPAKAGERVLAKGESLRFRYRILAL